MLGHLILSAFVFEDIILIESADEREEGRIAVKPELGIALPDHFDLILYALEASDLSGLIGYDGFDQTVRDMEFLYFICHLINLLSLTQL